jgi:S1-C subfamily serine protease
MNRTMWSAAALSLLLFVPAVRAQEPRAMLGAFVEQRAGGDADQPHVVVMGVTPGAPAAKAGLERGDVIAKFDDRDIRTIRDFFQALAQHKPGDKIKLAVLRDGKSRDLSVTLAERPGDEPAEQRPTAFLGIETERLTPAVKERLGVNVDSGAVVMEVMPGSPAAKAGLQRGDVITAINDKNVAGAEELRSAIRAAGAGKEVSLKVARGKETKDFRATLQAPSAIPSTLPGPLGSLERRISDLEKRVQELEAKKK